MKPLNRHILIDIEKPAESTSFGFIVETDKSVILERGTVVSKDQDVTLVDVGDVVFFKAYSISKVEIDKKEHAFLKEDEILGKE